MIARVAIITFRESPDAAATRALLAAGADPNAQTKDTFSSQRHGIPPSVIQTLRVKGAKFFTNVIRQGWSPLMLAVRENVSPELVRRLLRAGGNPNLGTAPENWMSLHLAGWKGNPDVIRPLLQHGGDPAAVTKDRRWTPLHVLARSGGRNLSDTTEAARIPLDAGVDPAAKDAKGRTTWDIIQSRHGRKLRKALDAGEVSAASRAVLVRLQKAAKS